MKKILFVVDEMSMGGVSKVLIDLLKRLDTEIYDIDLLVLHKRGELLADVPSHIHIIESTPFFEACDVSLMKARGKTLFSKLRLLFYMKSGLIFDRIVKERKKIIKKDYDTEIAFKEGFSTIFVASGDTKRKLNWVHVDYKVQNYSKHHMALMKKALSKIDLNVACSKVVESSYKEVFGIDDVITIHNMIDEETIKEKASREIDYPYGDEKINLITVARFHPQKALDRLIKAYAKVKDDYTLTIIGDGPLKKELFDLKDHLGVEVMFLGQIKDPYAYIKRADLFVLSSLYEGYPTVVIESLLSETPVLAMEVAGVKEQITKEYEGMVIPNDEKALLDALIALKDKKELLRSYKRELVSKHYDNTTILKEIEKIL